MVAVRGGRAQEQEQGREVKRESASVVVDVGVHAALAHMLLLSETRGYARPSFNARKR